MRPDTVDFHCHLDLYPDLAAAIAACDARRTATLAVTTTPKAFARNKSLASRSEFVRVALGFHPQLAASRERELSLFRELLPETRYVGEIGLDAGPRFYKSFEVQQRVFRAILQLCAAAGDKVITVHSTRAARQTLDLIEEELPHGRGRVVLHWFTGGVADTRRAIDLGCYFSVNERMVASPNGRRVLETVPDDRLLTETDGPFVERDGRPIEPGNVDGALTEIAALKGTELRLVRARISQNLAQLLS